MGSRKRVLDCTLAQLPNIIEPSMCGGDAAFFVKLVLLVIVVVVVVVVCCCCVSLY